MYKFIFLTLKDPWLPPSGGTSAFASQVLKVFNGEIAVVSMTSDKTISKGKWIDREYNGIKNKYLNIGCVNYNKKQIIPSRFTFFLNSIRHRRMMESIGIGTIFVDSPEAILTLSDHWTSVNYIFHGLDNPVKNSRYKFLRWGGTFFEKLQFRKMKKLPIKSVLAASDSKTIDLFNKRTNFAANVRKITAFPMSVDGEIFFCDENKKGLKNKLGIDKQIVLITVGRLATVKGWDLLLDSFQIFQSKNPDSLLVFVGDGEDRQKIESKIESLDLQQNVKITGLLAPSAVAKYINVADLGLVGSYNEGWSVAMCEILSCGKGIVSTDVSGASDMILPNKNGFIIQNRDPLQFCDCIENALQLNNVAETSLSIAEQFQLRNLKRRIEDAWQIS